MTIACPKGRGIYYAGGWRAAANGKKPKDCPYNKEGFENWQNWDRWVMNGGFKKQEWLAGYKAYKRKANSVAKKDEAANREHEIIAELFKELGL